MDKLKIAIVTIYSMNFGNRLQNYAVHRLLSDMGVECETLVCQRSFLRHICRNIYHFLGRLLSKKQSMVFCAFSKFVKRTTPVRFVYNKELKIPTYVSEVYDYCITGSDQVWNPEIRIKEKANYFLDFAPQQKRVCIAPSFGVSNIPSEYKDKYREWIDSFKYLSCRESEGIKLIKDLTGRKAELLIDPTMMLDKEMWRDVYQSITLPSQPYMLLYFLGEMPMEREKFIKKIAKENRLGIIDVLKTKKREYKNLQPDGLVQLIDGAAFVCTDSFHLTAFSINFNIPFFVFSRKSKEDFGNHMISRIVSLLELFHLEERLDPVSEVYALTCDFTRANKVLKDERKKEKEYLEKCFAIDEL